VRAKAGGIAFHRVHVHNRAPTKQDRVLA